MSSFRCFQGFLLTCGAVSFVVTSAVAQVSSSGAITKTVHDPTRARVLFEKAIQALTEAREHSWDPKVLEGACQLLEESRQLDRSPGTLKTLADCRFYQKRVATAHALSLEAADLAEDQNNSKLAGEAREFAKEIAPYRSFLTIYVNPHLPRLRVTLDEIEVLPSEYNEPIPVDPGKHAATAVAQGYQSKTLRVTIGESADRQRVELAPLDPLPPAPSNSETTSNEEPHGIVLGPWSAAPPSPPERARTNPWPWVIGGVGAGALLVGGVSGALALHDDSTVDNRCRNTSPCADVDALGIQRRRNFERSLAWATMPVGIVAVGAAATWLILERRSPQRNKAGFTALGATVANQGVTLMLGGGF